MVNENEESRTLWDNPIAKTALLWLLLLSPLGAPIIGVALIELCDSSWEGVYRCAVPQPLYNYFLRFGFMAAIWLGPFLALLWLILAAGLAAAAVGYPLRALWQAMMDRV